VQTSSRVRAYTMVATDAAAARVQDTALQILAFDKIPNENG
jgi:hypothetical protein